MASSRPKRASVSTSYSHLLKPLSDSEPESAGSDSTTGRGGASTGLPKSIKGKGKSNPSGSNQKPKRKGKKKASSDEDTDGSVYEEDDKASRLSSSPDAEEEAEPTDEDSGPDGGGGRDPDPEEDSEDDDRPSRSRSTAPTQSTAALTGKKPRPPKPNNARSLLPSLARTSSTFTRAKPPPGTREPTRDIGFAQAATVGPGYEPPARVFEDDLIVVRPALGGEERGSATMRWSGIPFAPEKDVLQDVGWWKGKWREGEEPGMERRWGGWYPEVEARVGPVLKGDALEPYLPHIVYPSQPTKVYTYKRSKFKPEQEDEDELEDEEADVMVVDQAEVQVEPSDGAIEVLLGIPGADDDDEEEEDPFRQKLVSIPSFTSRRLDEFLPKKPGHIANAGGPIISITWCPRADTTPTPTKEYLAIGTQSSSQTMSHTPHSSPSQIQIWSLDTSVPSDLSLATTNKTGKGLTFELGLCIDIGEPNDLQWCPLGGEGDDEDDEGDKLGILAGTFTDGSISIFAIPNPERLRKRLKLAPGKSFAVNIAPILRLVLPESKIFSFAWGSHELIAGGCNNGAIAIWSIGEALRTGLSTLRPKQYFRPHSASVRSLCFIRVPPFSNDLEGTVDLDGDPNMIASGSYDGGALLIDLRDPDCLCILDRERSVVMTTAFDPYTNTVLIDDGEDYVRSVKLTPKEVSASKLISRPQGTLWSTAISDHHPFLVTSSADGSCSLSNIIRPTLKIRALKPFARKIYRLDFNRKTGKYMMVDNLNPELRVGIEDPTARRKAPISVGAWAAETAVLKASWHPSLQRAMLLGSGMGCGLFRVDWVE